VPRLHDRFSYDDASTGEGVEVNPALHAPACSGQLAVDQDTGALLRGKLRIVHKLKSTVTEGGRWAEFLSERRIIVAKVRGKIVRFADYRQYEDAGRG